MSERPCRKDDPNWVWPCSCDDCSRAAAAAWSADMARVRAGEITLDEAQRLVDLDPLYGVSPRRYFG